MNSVESFSVETQSHWAGAAALPEARYGFALATYDSKLIAVGGQNHLHELLASMTSFNGTDWTTAGLTSLQTARTDHAMALHDGLLYVAGGVGGDYFTSLTSVEVYNGSAWSSITPMNTARAGLGLASYNGRLYAVGGYEDNIGDLKTVEFWDGTAWTVGADMSRKRSYLAVASHNGWLFAAGGENGGTPLSAVRTASAIHTFVGTLLPSQIWIPNAPTSPVINLQRAHMRFHVNDVRSRFSSSYASSVYLRRSRGGTVPAGRIQRPWQLHAKRESNVEEASGKRVVVLARHAHRWPRPILMFSSPARATSRPRGRASISDSPASRACLAGSVWCL